MQVSAPWPTCISSLTLLQLQTNASVHIARAGTEPHNGICSRQEWQGSHFHFAGMPQPQMISTYTIRPSTQEP